jgi:hypothetical protein
MTSPLKVKLITYQMPLKNPNFTTNAIIKQNGQSAKRKGQAII